MTRLAAWIVFATTALSCIGCASWRAAIPTAAPVTETREARHAQAVLAFEEQRDRAELEAAMDRWNQGDIGGCESRLRAILARRPSDVEAHIRLAELAWSMNNAIEAEAEYLAALRLAPDRADLEHALALVLEVTGRPAEASPHFARAAQLDPQNGLYRL